jgi:hypothetical protein
MPDDPKTALAERMEIRNTSRALVAESVELIARSRELTERTSRITRRTIERLGSCPTHT